MCVFMREDQDHPFGPQPPVPLARGDVAKEPLEDLMGTLKISIMVLVPLSPKQQFLGKNLSSMLKTQENRRPDTRKAHSWRATVSVVEYGFCYPVRKETTETRPKHPHSIPRQSERSQHRTYYWSRVEKTHPLLPLQTTWTYGERVSESSTEGYPSIFSQEFLVARRCLCTVA